MWRLCLIACKEQKVVMFRYLIVLLIPLIIRDHSWIPFAQYFRILQSLDISIYLTLRQVILITCALNNRAYV